MFFPPERNVELPGWNQATGMVLLQHSTIFVALFISLMTGPLQGAALSYLSDK